MKFHNLFKKKSNAENPLTEFGESLLLIVDPEQLKNNLLSKLRELINVEKAYVYLANEGDSSRFYYPVGLSQPQNQLPNLAFKDKLASWFRANREILFFNENKEVTRYLAEELAPFLKLSVNLAFPLVSMDRLTGIVFLSLPEEPLGKNEVTKIQTLGRQAGLAFENALLFKERLRQNERMFRAEQLATMGQFAAGVAHELRNPLTSIRSTIQFLSGEFEENDQSKKLAEDVLSEVDRLNAIIENLLNLAKPAKSEPQELEVNREIEQYIHFVEAQAKKQNVQIQTQFEENLPKIFCDPAELRQVLINLVLNSIQAMPDGGPIILRASLSPSKDDSMTGKRKVLIEVEDKGVGVSAGLSEKVFEPFFTTKSSGTGLGLTICNNIIRRLGGEIWIEQGTDVGTIVKVILPSA